jgi:hypothetical protein
MRILARVAVGLALLIAGVVGPLVDSTPANAQTQTETRPFRIDQCFDEGPVVFCVQSKGLTHRTLLANGDARIILRQDVCHSVHFPVNPEDDSDSCSKSRDVFIIKHGEPQVLRFSSRQRFAFPDQTCTFRVQYIYASGEARVDRIDSACT